MPLFDLRERTVHERDAQAPAAPSFPHRARLRIPTAEREMAIERTALRPPIPADGRPGETPACGRAQRELGGAVLNLLPPAPHAEETPRPVLSVSPQSWLTEGDSVTLICEVTDSSTDWTFSWYREGLKKDNIITYKDSSRGSRGSYTISPAALKHTGVYTCSAERDGQMVQTDHSLPQTLWITGESPPVSLIINPSRTQHFTGDSLSLSCEDQRHSTGWTVRRYTHSGVVKVCPGSVTGSTCKISSLNTSYTGVYWCESKSGENSNPVNITVHDLNVILESPVHPVTEGHPLTLRCLYRNTRPLNLQADFYKDGSVLQTQTTGEIIIHKVSRSDEGFYHCKYPRRGESEKSWVSVRREKSETPRPVLSVSPQSWMTEGDSVTLSCEITDPFTNWTFTWYRHIPINNGFYLRRELSDSSRGSGGSYTLSPAALKHTGVYVCRGKRRNPPFYTQYSNLLPLWITGEEK
ncbi:high affinity immunoglobulin gamma Fc receptor I-like [Clarias gariepinus]